jgi:DNA-binding GntR family transcriptional regulator
MATKQLNAYRKIKSLIEDGHLKGGERVGEWKVAKMVGMSRGPVRESLLRLQSEGLLLHKGSRRSRIVACTEEENLEEMIRRYELRVEIECGAVRQAAREMNRSQVRPLLQLGRRVSKAMERNDGQATMEAGQEYHDYLMANCGNPLFYEVWQSQHLAPTQPRSPELDDILTASVFASVSNVRDEQEALTDVAEAIAAHDEEEADRLMRRHLRLILVAFRSNRGKTNGHQPPQPHLKGPHL